MLTAAGLLLFAGVGTPQTRNAGDPRAIEAAVLAANADMERAAEAVDVEQLFTFMLDTDKGSIIQNGVFLATRGEALHRVTANLQGIRRIEYRWKRQHVTVLSTDVALLTAEGESIATITDGRVFTAPFAQTVVFVMREGRWKALHAHQSSPQVR
ncbi:MAG: nuclear transport factor 2 family protein [Vicinamibacterales bacterium]|nr:nuclear transport factor 2 family protein [Vicinamibacterales bacterium]